MSVWWIRYPFPAICFSLGTWQLYRLGWKERLIKNYQSGLSQQPLPFKSSADIGEDSKFRRLAMSGAPDDNGQFALLQSRHAREIGHDFASILIRPYTLESGDRVLVEDGLVPLASQKETFQIHTNPVVVQQPGEQKSWFLPKNNAEKGKWTHKNIKDLSTHFGTLRLLFKRCPDEAADDLKKLPPIATPIRVNLSNRHLEYVVTWYLMAAATFILPFIKK